MIDKSYELTQLADEDLENIAFYGFQQFGEVQAYQYHEGLIKQFDKITKTPLHYPVMDGFDLQYRRCVYQKHSIYFIDEESRVLIVRVLGKQDAVANLEH